MAFKECRAKGDCSTHQLGLTLDSNWRWLHNKDGYSNCFDNIKWDPTYCPDPVTCVQKCALEGVPSSDWASPYGVTQVSGGVQLNLVT